MEDFIGLPEDYHRRQRPRLLHIVGMGASIILAFGIVAFVLFGLVP